MLQHPRHPLDPASRARPFEHQECTVKRTPGQEDPARSVPQTAEQEDDDQIPVGRLRGAAISPESKSVAARRFNLWLLATFAVLALVLAAVGIYGVVSYSTRARTHEFGIRMALGADQSEVLREAMGRGLRLTVLGVGLGLAGSLGLTRLLEGLLFGVSARDPITFLVVGALLVAVALAATYLPARRATLVDPAVALRVE